MGGGHRCCWVSRLEPSLFRIDLGTMSASLPGWRHPLLLQMRATKNFGHVALSWGKRSGVNHFRTQRFTGNRGHPFFDAWCMLVDSEIFGILLFCM